MAFNPNIDYVGHQRLRAQGIEGVTRAKLQTKLRKEEEERRAAAARAAKKKKSSFGRKIVGAVARGAAAYYTGGASEASGLGGMIDQQIQGGSDYERNEYGDMVGAASSMSSLMTAKTANAASERLNAQSARDDAMQERMDKISPRAGMKFAEERAAKDAKNREVFEEYKGGFLNFGKDIDGLDLDATIGDYSGITNNKKVGDTKITPIDTSPSSTYSPLNQLGTAPPSKDVTPPPPKVDEATQAYFSGTNASPSQEVKEITDKPINSTPHEQEFVNGQPIYGSTVPTVQGVN